MESFLEWRRRAKAALPEEATHATPPFEDTDDARPGSLFEDAAGDGLGLGLGDEEADSPGDIAEDEWRDQILPAP